MSLAIATLEQFDLGLVRDGSVVLKPHNKLWDGAFAFESNRLAKQIGNKGFLIHHVGSTSVATISAKPILDLLLSVPSLTELDESRGAFETLGYEYKGEYGIPGRRYCVLYNTEKTKGYIHLHAFQNDHVEVSQHLLFRDYLRAFPDVAKQYEDLKQNLLVSNTSRSNYSEAKTPFIANILKQAEKWRGPNNFS